MVFDEFLARFRVFRTISDPDPRLFLKQNRILRTYPDPQLSVLFNPFERNTGPILLSATVKLLTLKALGKYYL